MGLGTVTSSPFGAPTASDRAVTVRFDGIDELRGITLTDRVDSANTIDVAPVGNAADITLNFIPKGGGKFMIRGVPVFPILDAGVVSVDFSVGATISTVQALTGRVVLLSLARTPSATGMFYSANVVDGVSFDINGDAALGTVDVCWAVLGSP